MTYPGGKAGAGVYQKLINLIPPHNVYYEPFAGDGAVFRMKRPAYHNIIIDLDAAAIERLQQSIVTDGESTGHVNYDFRVGCGVSYLAAMTLLGDEFVYCDPPYPLEARSSARPLYRHEFTEREHRWFLRVVKKLNCCVMISSYWTELYAEELADWNIYQFEAMTRAGTTAVETVWYNYPTPLKLHDYRYLGTNFRERERIKRKKERWANRLRTMPVLERQALLAAIEDVSPTAPPETTMPAGTPGALARSDDEGLHRQK